MTKFIARFLGYLMSWLCLGALTALMVTYAILQFFQRDLPNIDQLNDYAPATISRVYSGEGIVLDEFSSEKRLFTPADEIPDLVKHAFISAEDKNFYTHPGYDLRATAGAMVEAVRGQGERGASTIPQQVAKNFFLSGEQKIERKIKEALIAVKLVNEIPRDQILSLYLNEIFLGQNSYGVTAAARTYFAKSLEELSTEEVAYLAVNPKAPNDYHPVKNYDKALERRNFVLKEMFENGYIDEAEFNRAKDTKILTVQSGDIESYKASLPPRDYFTDEIRRQLTEKFGEETLLKEGLSVRATIDRKLQYTAQKALERALENYDRSLGKFNGSVGKIKPEELAKSWEEALSNAKAPRDIEGWYLAVILDVGEDTASIGIEKMGQANLPFSDVKWANYVTESGKRAAPKSMGDLFKTGDIILVKKTEEGGWTYRQVPVVSGAFAAMDPQNGRVLALVGGFSYQASNFDRATQAMRQPGSSFKPFVYAAALDNNYQPNSLIVDAPIKIDTPQGVWEPENASKKFYGPTPMMTGLEQSRNLMTIRLAKDVGMEIVADYGERYGVYDKLQPVLANALGAQETTLYRMISAYSTFANGGKKVSPTVVDRVQDRTGKTIFRHDERDCVGCVDGASPSTTPQVMSNYEQVMNPVTAVQIRIMLQSAVARGTSKATVGKLHLPIAGKTGTTNDAKDVWFIGFTPNIVAGCYIGYDNPTSLGRAASGSGICGPVFVQFIKEALKTHGGFEYAVPENGYYVNIDRFSGARLADGAKGDNVVKMFFGNDTVPDVGVAPAVIDGGYKMGEDVPLIGNDGEGKTRDVEVKVNGKKTNVPKNPSAATISGGGLY